MIYFLLGVDIFIRFFHYIEIKAGFRTKFFITIYYFIGLLHIMIYFPKYIIFGLIRIIIFKFNNRISFDEYFDNLWF